MNIAKEILLNQLIKVPFIQEMAKKTHSTGRNNDPSEVNRIFSLLEQHASFQGKTVLELGPGHTFGLLEKARQAGAASLYAVDIMTYVQQVPEGIQYRRYDGKAIPMETNAVDVLWSWSVFEHIRYPLITLPETYRVLKPGGIAIHSIDLVDHFNYTWKKDELTFNCLKYPEWLWNAMTWNRSNYVNRIRWSRWIELFESAGFSVLHQTTEVNKKVAEMHQNGQIPYLNSLSNEDASRTALFIVVQKNP